MRDRRQLLQNMPEALCRFYADHIDLVRDGIREYWPARLDAGFLERMTGLPELFAQDLDAVYETMFLPTQEYLDRGGKVLRPILVALILKAYGADPAAFRLFLGAIEAMEDSSIMMDDYIDGSLIRRGGPCGHVAHGYALANISSCTAFAMAHYLINNNELDLPAPRAAALLRAFAWEHIQMAYGQIQELHWTESNVNTVTVGQYLQETIARCAFLSFRGPLRYAGLLAEAPAADIGHLERLGDYMLIAYHIRGDDLDMAPDSAAWGKIAGEDITTGRRTLLINYLLEKTSPQDRDVLVAVLNSRTREESEKRKVYDLVLKYDGFGFTRKLAADYCQKARAEVACLHIPPDYRELLDEFCEFAGLRRAV